ncbi:MAG: hypothetical protein WC385_00975 [Candidatus Paceibacterota bacterium]|jgi:hypothetical protein
MSTLLDELKELAKKADPPKGTREERIADIKKRFSRRDLREEIKSLPQWLRNYASGGEKLYPIYLASSDDPVLAECVSELEGEKSVQSLKRFCTKNGLTLELKVIYFTFGNVTSHFFGKYHWIAEVSGW